MRWSEKFKWAVAFIFWLAAGLVITKKLIAYLYC
jgi:hypothetical protein